MIDPAEGVFTKELLDEMVRQFQSKEPHKRTYRTRCGILLAEYMNRALGLLSIPELKHVSNYDLILEIRQEYKYKDDLFPFGSWARVTGLSN
jgi:hypothetical protein